LMKTVLALTLLAALSAASAASACLDVRDGVRG
jgi:hypothetical protein